MSLNSSVVVAGADILAADLNERRLDLLQKAGEGVLATGTANAIVLTVDAQVTAYSSYQKFIFKAAETNTGAVTINVNSIGAKTIKKETSLDLVYGDIIAGKIYEIVYDGTNMQMLAQKNIKFGGSGADGVQTDTDLTITGSDNTYIVKNFSSWTAGSVARTCTITPTGCIAHIKIQGNADFTNWTFDFDDKGVPGTAGGDGGSCSGAFSYTDGNDGTDLTPSNPGYIIHSQVSAGKKGHGASDGGTGGGSGGGGGNGGSSLMRKGVTGGASASNGDAPTSGYTPVPINSHINISAIQGMKSLVCSPGLGGTGGGGGGAVSSGPTSTGGDGGLGGTGGGALILEVNGNIIFDSTVITANGSNGEDGEDGTNRAGGGGGGGGGAGGVAIILYNGLLTGSVTPTVTQGSGGAGGAAGLNGGSNGGAGGDGATGSYLIEKNSSFI